MKLCHSYLVRFDGPGQLWRQKDVWVFGPVVQVHQDSALCIRMVQEVVDVSASRLTVFFLVSGFIADAGNGVALPQTQVDHICTEGGNKG